MFSQLAIHFPRVMPSFSSFTSGVCFSKAFNTRAAFSIPQKAPTNVFGGPSPFASTTKDLRTSPMRRWFSTEPTPKPQTKPPQKHVNSLAKFKETQASALSPQVKKVVEGTKKTAYGVFTAAGIAVVGGILFTVVKDMILPQPDINLFHKSLPLVQNSADAAHYLGGSITGYAGGRGPAVESEIFKSGNDEYIRIQYHVEGSRQKGIVTVEARKISSSEFEYNVMYLDLPAMHKRIIIDVPSSPSPKASSQSSENSN
eukprot:TRINITY_DN1196_c0_g2_i1.p1 TRINITY_DN1196_c0_g2~~TRINITY_DN1196_c0_g2_i1.p1  ORF type:complete len:257 (+),score=60.39 TRINITY_DN1196_c0_g2_i1:49-819(+)